MIAIQYQVLYLGLLRDHHRQPCPQPTEQFVADAAGESGHVGSEKMAVFRVVDEDGGVADGNVVCPGEVDGELIHTDAPDDGKKMSADPHHGLPGEIPREAVSVANRQDGDAAVPLSPEGAALAHSLTS